MRFTATRLLVLLFLIVGLIPFGGVGSLAAAPAVDKVDPALRKLMVQDPGQRYPIIVEMVQPSNPWSKGANEQQAQKALLLLSGLGKDGYPVGALPLIDAAAGFANAKGVESLNRNSAVSYIYEDSLVKPSQAKAESSSTTPAGLISPPYPRVVRADKVWLDGPTGKGVTVAVLDSGIAPSDDLMIPTRRLLAAVNFAGDLDGMADAGGHGTHVAGIIAGNGTGSDLSRRQSQPVWSGDAAQIEYVGIAPGANVVDVRVLNKNGYGRASSVIRGIEWSLAHRDEYNIRVLNLSFGAPARHSYRIDPLTAAVEIAWHRGMVVVSATGNTGPNSGTVETPGVDPYLITVGATSDEGSTLSATDDGLAWFSSWGIPTDSTPKPDVVAPGRRIVSLRSPGSYLDRIYPDRLVAAKTGANYFRLTGTSSATAVVSGVVALMLERQPGLRPDQVKALLMATTQAYGQDSKVLHSDPSADGAGLVDAYAAVKSNPVGLANRGLRPANTLARSLLPILYGQPIPWKDPYYAGTNWNDLAWDDLAWDNLAWDNLAWDDLAWDNLAWDNLAWDNLAWDNLAWDNLAWDDLAWDSMKLD